MSLVLDKKWVTIVLAVVLLSACSKSEPEKAAEQTASASMAVSLAKAQSRTIERSIIASGPVSPWEEMQLGVELSGVRVTSLKVDVGQQVKRGQYCWNWITEPSTVNCARPMLP